MDSITKPLIKSGKQVSNSAEKLGKSIKKCIDLETVLFLIKGLHLSMATGGSAQIYIFGLLITVFLIGFFWIAIIAGVIYAAIFFYVLNQKSKLRDSNLVYLLAPLYLICEWVLFLYLAMAWMPVVVVTDTGACAGGFIACFLYRAITGSNYKIKNARIIALLVSLVIVISNAVFMSLMEILLTAIFFLVVALYEAKMISKINRIHNRYGGDYSVKIVMFCLLLILKYKIKYLFLMPREIYRLLVDFYKKNIKRQ